MTDISFYHLSRSPLEKTLAKLLEKVVASDKKAVVLADTPERVASLDGGLWTYSQISFLPHGTAADGMAEHQPIYLTTTLENPNEASFLVITDGTVVTDFQGFERCLDIFNGLDPSSVEQARERWRTYKSQGHNLTYWFQNDEGAWEQKKI